MKNPRTLRHGVRPYRPPRRRPLPRLSPARAIRFDRIGQLLALLGLTALVAGIIEVGSAGLSAPRTLMLLGVGVAASVAFVFSQTKVRALMMPLGLFRVRGMQVALQIGFIMIFNWYGMVFICTMFLQNELGMGAFAAGLSVVGFGVSVTTPAAAGVVLRSVNPAQAGIASAMFNTFRQVGGAIGVAVFGVIATFPPSLTVSLRTVFAASALLLVYVLTFELLRWREN